MNTELDPAHRANISAIARLNGALVITLQGDKMLFLPANGADGSRLGFGLPQGFALGGEDIATCARRVVAEQLGVAPAPSAVRYIGSIALEAYGKLYWQPIVLAHLPEAARPDGKGMLTCPQSSVDALVATGGVAQAASLAALSFYAAKRRVGHLA